MVYHFRIMEIYVENGSHFSPLSPERLPRVFPEYFFQTVCHWFKRITISTCIQIIYQTDIVITVGYINRLQGEDRLLIRAHMVQIMITDSHWKYLGSIFTSLCTSFLYFKVSSLLTLKYQNEVHSKILQNSSNGGL